MWSPTEMDADASRSSGTSKDASPYEMETSSGTESGVESRESSRTSISPPDGTEMVGRGPAAVVGRGPARGAGAWVVVVIFPREEGRDADAGRAPGAPRADPGLADGPAGASSRAYFPRSPSALARGSAVGSRASTSDARPPPESPNGSSGVAVDPGAPRPPRPARPREDPKPDIARPRATCDARGGALCPPERARGNLPSSPCRPRGQQRSQLLTRAGFSADDEESPREGCVRISERRSADDPPDASPWSPRSSPRRTPRPTAARCSTHSRSTSPTRRWSASSSSSSSSTEPSPASGCPSTCVPISAAAAPRLSRPDASSGVRHPVPRRLELLPSAPRPARPRGRASTTRANARPTPGALPVPPAAAPRRSRSARADRAPPLSPRRASATCSPRSSATRTRKSLRTL